MTKKTKAEICEHVRQFRERCAVYGLLDANGVPDLPRVYEYLPYIWSGWSFIPKEHGDMGNRLGATSPGKKLIALRNDVYEGMCQGEKEHLYTAAHELGHMVMHEELVLARWETCHPNEKIDEEMEVEAEADAFATELLGFQSPANQHALRLVREWVPKMLKRLKP